MGNTVGMLQGDNSAGYCFVLRILIPMNFLKYVVIMKLKMCTIGKIFGKNLSKSYWRYFFPICGLQSKEGWGEA